MTAIARRQSGLVREHFHIPSDTPGIRLHIRNIRPAKLSIRPESTIVMVHGATYSSGSLYDVPLGGTSFMEFLADEGFDVFAVDVRGYGLSSRPSELEADARLNPPLVKTETGLRDLSSAVDFVLALRGLDRLNIFGMSWGGTLAGAYASLNHDVTLKLAVVAPQWLSDIPVPLDPGGHLDAYRLVPVADARKRWLDAVPPDARAGLIPEGWFEQWAEASLAEDPWSGGKAPGRLRATNGPIQDVRDYWRAGKPFYRPSDIVSPVLLVHGEWDRDVPIDLALAYFQQLSGAKHRRWLEVGEATHMLLLEKNRLIAYRAISSFFSENFSAEE